MSPVSNRANDDFFYISSANAKEPRKWRKRCFFGEPWKRQRKSGSREMVGGQLLVGLNAGQALSQNISPVKQSQQKFLSDENSFFATSITVTGLFLIYFSHSVWLKNFRPDPSNHSLLVVTSPPSGLRVDGSCDVEDTRPAIAKYDLLHRHLILLLSIFNSLPGRGWNSSGRRRIWGGKSQSTLSGTERISFMGWQEWMLCTRPGSTSTRRIRRSSLSL